MERSETRTIELSIVLFGERECDAFSMPDNVPCFVRVHARLREEVRRVRSQRLAKAGPTEGKGEEKEEEGRNGRRGGVVVVDDNEKNSCVIFPRESEA